MMLHNDEDYQKGVGDPEAMDAILNDVKQHPEKLQKCDFPFQSCWLHM